MPDMTPVAQDIQTPNPVNAFANVVALKRGMTDLNTAQAQSQQAQQQNQELTALHQFIAKAMNDPAYKNPDGSPNTQKFQQDAMAVAPTYGQPYIGQASANFNEGIANRQALLDLNNKQRSTIGGFFGQVAAKPNASKADMLDAIEQAREQSSDPGYQRSLDSALMHMPSTAGMNMADESNTLRQFARGVSLQFNSPDASESAPNMSFVQGPKGLETVQTNPQSPLGIGPQGAPVKQGVAPSIQQQPGTGGLAVVNSSGQATPITASGGQGGTNWWNPAPGQLAMLQGNTAGIVQRTQSAAQAANTSPQAIDALTRAQSILDSGTWTGTAFSGFKDLKNLAASLGMDTSTAANASELAKNLARFEAARASSVGDTDAARSLVEQSGPNSKMDATAVKAVIQQSLANEQAIQGYARLMQNSPDPQTATQRETQFRSVPHLIQAYELGQMKSKEEADAFAKRYNIPLSELAKSAQQLREMGAL